MRHGIRKKSKTSLGLGLLIIIILSSAYGVTHEEVSVTALTQTLIPSTVSAYGEVISPGSVVIRAQVNGIVTTVDFSPGQKISTGQLLFTLRSNDASAQLEQSKAELVSAKAIYERYKNVSRQYKGSVSEVKLIQANAAYEKALAQYNETAAVHNIISPINGVISDTPFSPGAYVASGKKLAYITNQKNLQLRYQLPSQYNTQAALGQTVLFYPKNTKESYKAIVSYVSPAMNTTNYNITLRANLSPTNQLQPNTFGRVVQTIDSNRKVFAISQSLLKTDSNGFYVYVVNAKNRVIKKHCKLGELTASGLVVIKSGLKAGDNIITSNTDNIKSGQTVRIKNQ